MAPFAKSFGQAFSQSYDAESKRRRQKEDEIAQEGRLEERMGRTRAYELGQELERENRSATRQLDLERRANELYDTRQSANDVRALEKNARDQAEAANLRETLQGEQKTILAEERQRVDDEARFLAVGDADANIGFDFTDPNWRTQIKNEAAYKAYEANRAIYDLPKLPREGTPPLSKFADPLEEFDALGEPIEFGYKVVKPTDNQLAEIEKLSRDRLETVKDLASQRQIRESDQAFFREASSLVPLEYQSQITDKDGNITKSGQAFLRSNVKMKDFTYFDQIKGKDFTERRLTFIRPVQEPVGKNSKDDVIVGGEWKLGAPVPGMYKDGTELPMSLPPIIETQGQPFLPMPGTAFNTPVDYLRDWNTPSNLRTQMRRVGLPEDFIPGNARDVRDMEEALDMGIRKNRYQKYIAR